MDVISFQFVVHVMRTSSGVLVTEHMYFGAGTRLLVASTSWFDQIAVSDLTRVIRQGCLRRTLGLTVAQA